jgi:GT2 family glycosyltransferase
MEVKNIGVVIVTYGDRLHLLQEVIRKLGEFKEVEKIILVNNNPKKILDSTKYQNVIMINNKENLGSAKGYKQGIEKAFHDKELEFIWLLDDDNKPKFSCLKELQESINSLKQYKLSNSAFLCVREDRKAYSFSTYGFGVRYLFPSKNSCLGLNIIDLLPKYITKNICRKHFTKFKKKRIVEVPVAPYGGLIFHKSLISSIGFPKEELFLYSDDNEYSYRISENGGSIYLVSNLEIEDIDNSWFIRSKGNYLDSLYDSEELFRIYYTIRNRIYTENKYLVKNRIIYKLNRLVYLLLLLMYALKYKNFSRYKFLLKAISDGDKSKIGKVDNEYFTY